MGRNVPERRPRMSLPCERCARHRATGRAGRPRTTFRAYDAPVSWRNEGALGVVVLVLGTVLVTRLVQRDQVWAGLWAVCVALVVVEMARRAQERPDHFQSARSTP